jgi:hypothetical protein
MREIPGLSFLHQLTSVIIQKKLYLKKHRRNFSMVETKDFATGCLTIILCVILFPLFFLVFKLTLMFAVILAIVIGIILGITLLGRIVRLLFTGK